MESTLSERREGDGVPDPAARAGDRDGLDWSSAVLDVVSGALGLRPDATVVVLGAGTDALARAAAERFARVVVVEPAAERRAAPAAAAPRVEVRDGDAVPLGEGEADAVVVAEVPWLEPPRVLAEAARVLRPDGGVALLWHVPDGPWQPALPPEATDLVRRSGGGEEPSAGPRRDRWRDAVAAAPFEPPTRAEVAYDAVRDRDGVVADLTGAVAALPAAERDRLRARLGELVPEGTYRRPVRVEVHWARSTVAHWCDRCGGSLREGSHTACVAARALEPPRYCPRCRRRMKVQVLPAGWRAACVAHGELSGSSRG